MIHVQGPQIISFVLIHTVSCYSGDPKHVYYNENMVYFHNPYWGANKELQGIARAATICVSFCNLEIQITVILSAFRTIGVSAKSDKFHQDYNRWNVYVVWIEIQ